MSRRLVLKHSIALVGMLVCVSCLLILIITILKLAEAPPRNRLMGIYHPTFKSTKVPHIFKLGQFGEIMVEMLPQDLAFTLFIASEEALKCDLHLSINEKLIPKKIFVSILLPTKPTIKKASSIGGLNIHTFSHRRRHHHHHHHHFPYRKGIKVVLYHNLG